MSWQKQKQKKTDNSGLGTAAAVGVAAVGVAALAWGAKKLYDFVQEKKEEPMGHESTPPPRRMPTSSSEPQSFHRFSSPEHEASFTGGPEVKVRKMTPTTPTAPPEICSGWDQETSSSTCASSPCSASFCIIEDVDVMPSILQNEMIDYYDNYVHIPKRAGRQAMKVATDIIRTIQSHIDIHSPGLIEEIFGTGSAFDGTQVIRADNFDVLIPIKMPENDAEESGQWTSLDGRQSLGLDAASGFSLVLTDDQASPHCDLNDKLVIDGQFLSPMKARIFFRELIQNAVKEYPEDGPYKITVSSVGCVTSVSIQYEEKQMNINFMPTVKMGTRLLTANPYPRFELENEDSEEEGYRKLWEDCFAHEEAERLCSLPMHENCHIRCLKIMKAVCLNDTMHLGRLSSYHLKTLLFHMMDKETDWDSSKLGERVAGLFDLLDFYLRERRLPHYYLPDVNLFEQFGRHELDDLKNYMTSVLRKGSIGALLKTDY